MYEESTIFKRILFLLRYNFIFMEFLQFVSHCSLYFRQH